MSRIVRAADLKAVLRDAGADFVWRAASGRSAYRIGPDLDDAVGEAAKDDAQLLGIAMPVIPILGNEVVQVNDHAVYYVAGEARPLPPLLAEVPEWRPADVHDVVIASATETFDG